MPDELREQIAAIIDRAAFGAVHAGAADEILAIPMLRDALIIARAVDDVLGPVLHSIAEAIGEEPRPTTRRTA